MLNKGLLFAGCLGLFLFSCVVMKSNEMFGCNLLANSLLLLYMAIAVKEDK